MREDLKNSQALKLDRNYCSSQKLLIGSIYRHPDDLNVYDNFQKALEQF